ncbi:MAG: protein kinase domain-containing protein [Myxococcaceae bacterium]
MKKPSVFGKYLLLERINVGGMAEVFIAKAFGVEGFERILAIKKILPTMAEDEEFITMFIDEARISVQLNHANIVHIHELGKHDDTYFIAMEYVAGRDLRTILERYRRRKEIMPTAQAVYVASKMCEGLDYAHRRKDARGQDLNIIHRDVSPQNILVSYDGEVKIIDFGIAKAANRSQKTQAGILKGKFGYMSPEQVRGLPIDRRSDVFAVGVIIYEMLTGEKLFVGESDFSTLEKVRNADVPTPRQFNPNIPPGLEKVLLKALAREQEDRYQWGSDLQEDLMRFLLAGEAIYSAKHLQAFMKEAFAEDLLREAEKIERFAAISRPDQIESSGVTAEVERGRRRPSQQVQVAHAPPRASGRASVPSQQAVGGGRQSVPAMSAVSGGSGAVATGPQEVVNIPPPSPEELAEMDGAAYGDRTQIVDALSPGLTGEPKTNIGSSPDFSDNGTNSAVVPMGEDVATGAFPRANGQDLDTGANLQVPSEQGHLLDETLPPANKGRSTSKPQVIIGDAVAYSGATVIGPLPATRGNGAAAEADDDESDRPPPSSTVLLPQMERSANAEEEAFDEEPSPELGDRTDANARPVRSVEYDDSLEDDEEPERSEVTGPTQSEVSAAKPQRRPPPPALNAQRGTKPKQQNKTMLFVAAGGALVLLVVAVLLGFLLFGKSTGTVVVIVTPDKGVKITIKDKVVANKVGQPLPPGDYEVVVKPPAKFKEARRKIKVVAGSTVPVNIVLEPAEAAVQDPPDKAAQDKALADKAAADKAAADKAAADKAAADKAAADKAAADKAAADQGGGDKAAADKAAADKAAADKAAADKSAAADRAADKAADKAAAAEKAAADKAAAAADRAAKRTTFTATFRCREPGVEVLVDGRSAGKTPNARLAGLNVGQRYQVSASRAGFKPYEGSFTGDGAKEEQEISFKLEKDRDSSPLEKAAVTPVKKPRDPTPTKSSKVMGKLACATRPAGAEVWVDGKNTNRQTPVPISNPLVLPAGPHKVVFKLSGKQSGPHPVVITDDGTPYLLKGIQIE